MNRNQAARAASIEPAGQDTGALRLVRPAVLLRIEGLAALIVTVLLYREVGESWWWFALLFFAPDLTFAGYAAGPKIGSVIYNAAHTTVLPLALAGIGVVGDSEMAVAVALIWLAHIAMDRMLGYGLKLPTGFKDTHLG